MKIYIDSDYRCYVEAASGLREIETEFFAGKCKEYIEGYRFVPFGETWTNSKGIIFRGEMICPAEDFSRLEKAQRQYEHDDSARLATLGISKESTFIATRNYSKDSFISVLGDIYEVISAIPVHTSIIVGQNAIKTTVEHYLDTLKESEI